MGWRETDRYHKPRKITIQTCDMCGKDIGTPDGMKSLPHYSISREPGHGSIEDPDQPVDVCSVECLREFVKREIKS